MQIIGGGASRPKDSDAKNVCLSESPPCNSFQSQPPPKISIYLPFVNVRMISERIAVVRVPCMARLTTVIHLPPPPQVFNLTGVKMLVKQAF